ncbi:MAG: PDZ domain-containing protein [Desulfobulbaceae bacterium]|nr:PDZ domain-containing protein [Desulfobulbaceae bacterium]
MNPTSFFNHPLTLIGLVLLGVFGLFKLILKSGLLSKVTRKETAPILHKLLNFGFVLALSVVVAGFGLEAWRIHKQIDQIQQAKKAIIGEILTNICNLDERLGFFQQTLEPDTFARQLDKVRQKVVPALRQNFAAGYNRLIMEQKITALRQMMNSSPLTTASGRSLLESLRDSGMNTEKFRKFYNQLAEVERVTEDFLDTLGYIGTMGEEPGALQTEYSNRNLQVTARNISIESQAAYLYALAILRDANTGPHAVPLPHSAATTLQALEHLQPKGLIDQKQTAVLLSELVEQKSQVIAEKTALLSLAEQLNHEKLRNFKEIDEQLKINPTDTWNEVVGKAISLRQFERKAEAVAAFSRYGEMFDATDPTARRYAHTAQQFTTQLEILGVSGGAYIFEIKPGGKAEQVGLEAGDIIIEYNGHIITDMSVFVEAAKSAQAADTVPITWLRLNDSGRFEQHNKIVPGGILGAGTMPI